MRTNTHRRPLVILAVVCLMAVALVAIGTGAATAAPKKPLAKNVIVMIADGWGFNHDVSGSYYGHGIADERLWNEFPTDLAMSTYMAYDEGDGCYGLGYDPVLAWGDFDYVTECYTDSAAAATAMSTGVKTYGGAIGVDIDENPVTHVLEVAEMHGKATGVITSVEWTHATPAGFAAHNTYRGNYAEIGTQMVYDSAVDVIMGAGHPFYDGDGVYVTDPDDIDYRYSGGQSTWDGLVAGTAGGDADGDGDDDPWVLITTRAEFQSLAIGPTPDRVIGVAPVRWTLQQGRSGDPYADPFVVPFVETIPTLEEMAKGALNILDEDPDGFFLMIEGGAIDWASHANYSGRMIEEETDFEAAFMAVMDWVEAHSNWGETLLVVTADHETGYLTGPGSDPTWTPIVNNGAGLLPGMEWHSGEHTNSLVPFFAKGDTARLFKRYADEYDPAYGRYLDNTEMAEALFRTLASG
jgi:alkaline phosphatase